MVTFKNVTKNFWSITALDNVSFSIDPGEFVFITGQSGAGKTTILRLILRDIAPNKGEIIAGGKNIAELKTGDVPLYRRAIGVVFQDLKLLMDRTVGENVELALAVREVSKAERGAKAKEALASVGLKGKEDMFPSQLAGGELQRVVIARAIVGRPKLILADEPTGNLDPDTAWEIIDLLEKIRKNGATIIMATHNKDVVNRKKARVISLQDGKIVRDKKDAQYVE